MSRSKVNLGQTKDLLKNIADKVDNDTFKIKYIDIDLISPSKDNFFEIRDVDELANDIESNGLYHNLVVAKVDDKYEIISGERRYHALKKLGFDKIPCKIDSITDSDEKVEKLIQANYSTRELNDYEKLLSIIKLYDVYENQKSKGKKLGKVRDKIGKELGLSGGHVQKYKKINDYLIPELKELFKTNKITFRDCHEFCNLEKDQQLTIYKQLKENLEMSKDEMRKMKKEIKENLISVNQNSTLESTEDKIIEPVEKYTESIKNPETNLENQNIIPINETNTTILTNKPSSKEITQNKLNSKLKTILKDLEYLKSEIKSDTDVITEVDKDNLISLHDSINEILELYKK